MSKESNKSGGISLGAIVFIVFLVLKLAGIGTVATWSWWWVTSPLWIPVLVYLGFIAIAGAIVVLINVFK